MFARRWVCLYRIFLLGKLRPDGLHNSDQGVSGSIDEVPCSDKHSPSRWPLAIKVYLLLRLHFFPHAAWSSLPTGSRKIIMTGPSLPQTPVKILTASLKSEPQISTHDGPVERPGEVSRGSGEPRTFARPEADRRQGQWQKGGTPAWCQTPWRALDTRTYHEDPCPAGMWGRHGGDRALGVQEPGICLRRGGRGA